MNFLCLLLLSISSVSQVVAFTITSTSTIKGRSTAELQTFLATPTNWPSIVLSSFGVEEADAVENKRAKINAVDRPLKKGERVKEIFGLPPLLPLAVTWTCQQNVVIKPNKKQVGGGCLEFFSADGLSGIAENCSMKFEISAVGDDTKVDMTVEIDPVNPIANLAPLVLKVDNDLALKVLLPLALKNA
mmetsp:Transcript_8737/g.13214  ORF Transcript_8737/g.13214 Transcript_8737/m.13214 type:complete len:188 (-) Transcript_8737:14-577(-)